MASIVQVGNKWRVQVRRKGHTKTRTFVSNAVAEKWARKIEAQIDAGEFHDDVEAKATTVADLIQRFRKDRVKPIGRSHDGALKMIESRMGDEALVAITKDRLVRYAKTRGCGPVTWSAELSYLGSILRVARAVWNLPVAGDPVGDARAALSMLGYRTKSKERERRPTAEELTRIVAYFATKPRQQIPMDKIIPFAVATAMRASEITRLRWADVNELARTVVIRDRKDPQEKQGNDQEVPLLPAAWAIVQSMPKDGPLIFPFNAKTFSSIFPRACAELGIVGLRFHDLRHEGTSRLFEMGYAIEEVAIWTGHREWKQLKRYTQIAASSLHRENA